MRTLYEETAPISLHDPDAVWRVEAGQVDVFVLLSGPEGPAAGRWHHVDRLETGDSLWGAPPSDDVLLLARPLPDAQVERRARADVLAVGGPAYKSLERWLAKLTGALHALPAPGHWTALTSDADGDEFPQRDREGGSAFDAGEALVPADFLWVRHRVGASRWSGRRDLILTSEDGFVPLPGRSWLETSEAATDLERCTTAQLDREPGRLPEAVDGAYRVFMKAFARDVAAAERAAAERLAARRRHDRALMEDALQRLAGSARADNEAAALVDSDDGGVTAGVDDALFQACRWVGRARGIVMKPPPSLVAGRAGTDPINDIALASHVQVRPVRLRGDWWRQDNGPLLGFLDEDDGLHPVALLPRSPWSYDVLDPRTGERRRAVGARLKDLHPQAFMFYPSLPARAVTGLDLLRLGANAVWGRDVLVVLFMGLAVGGLGMLLPIVTGDLFDRVIPQADTAQIWPLALLLLAAALGSLLFEFTRSVAMLRVEGRLETAIQSAVWDRVVNLPARFFRNYPAGDLAVRAMGINAIRQSLSGVALTTILSSVFSVFNFGLLFYYDRALASIATLVLAGSVLVTSGLGYSAMRFQRHLTDMQGRISGLVLQLINGINKFRMAGAEERAFFLWASQFSRQRRLAFKARTVQNVQATVHAVLPVATNLVLFSAFMARQGGAGPSPGHFLAFMAAFGTVNGALMALSGTLLGLLHIVPLYERAKPILEEVPEVDASREDPGPLAGEIELSHVFFRYDADGPLIVDGASMLIRPGQFVAVVGPSGQGKSTLLRLLLGFEKPQSGSIYYDGKDLATLDVRAVRRQIGVVLQNGTVTQGDIYSNIVGAANLGMDDAWEAARMAGLAADIEKMPMGMHTMIPDGGGTLSGGQRQRLLIARALVRKPRILFFDEATSALDNVTQAVVMRSLAELRATRVVIAHRLSTVQHADRIFVFNRGRVVQEGTYDELMAQGGMFAELVRRQLA